MNKELTLDQVKSVLGEPRTKIGGEYVWQCPYCMDSHKDNMRFNEQKGLLWCFADPEHSKEVLRQIAGREKREVVVKMETEQPKWEIMQEKYGMYLCQCQDELLNNQEILDYLYKKRGLTKKVLDLVCMGYDSEAKQFVIPILGLQENAITDFELRAYGDKKVISRIGGGHNTIAVIYGSQKAKTLYIVEGFLDGYALLQFLLDKNMDDFMIYSCSHGVNSLLKCMPMINFANFGEVKLMLDADEAGDKATKEIIEQYPFIKDARQFLFDTGCKDVGEWVVCQALFT